MNTPNLTQVKATAKKRLELLSKRLELPHPPSSNRIKVPDMCLTGMPLLPKEYREPKLSDVYETMAQEAGFNDWNGYSAFLKDGNFFMNINGIGGLQGIQIFTFL